MDSKRRSFTKTITWRIIAFLTTIIISFIISGTWELSFVIAISTNFTKIILFYLHERLWEKTGWERDK